LKKKNTLYKLISYLVIFIFTFQCSIGIYADNMSMNTGDKGNSSIKKEKKIPELDGAKVKKPHKIPNGLLKKADAFEKWKNKKELLENRTENSKTYLNEDGTKTSVIFFQTIHVKDSEGKFIEIDSSLVEIAGKGNKYAYKNKTGLFDVYFTGKEGKQASYKVQKGNISIEISPEDAINGDMIVEGSQVFYSTNKVGIGYLYTVHELGVKEDIIVSSYREDLEFTYEMDVNGPAEVVEQDGTILITDKKTGENVFALSAPYMEDAQGTLSNSIELRLEQNGGSYSITLIPDDQWLKDAARAYPVKIDPSATIGSSEISDNFVQQIKPRYSHNLEDMIYVGYDDGIRSTNSPQFDNYKGKTRGYMGFILPQEITDEVKIQSAELKLYKYTHWLIPRDEDNLTYRSARLGESVEREVQLYKILQYIDINGVTYETQPAPDADEEPDEFDEYFQYKTSTTINQETKWYQWDIKSLIEDWTKEDNYGIMLKLENESEQADCFYSTNNDDNKPCVEIIYTDMPVEDPVEPSLGDLELVLERNDIMENGVAYAKGTVEYDAGSDEEDEEDSEDSEDSEGSEGEEEEKTNRLTIEYKLMPDGGTGEIVEENFDIYNWETEHFNLDLDKAYWVEAHITVEEWEEPEEPEEPSPPADGETEVDTGEEDSEEPEPEGEYKIIEEKDLASRKFVVCEVQPGDTLRRLAKHYLGDGNKYNEIYQLNKLTNEALTVGQKLFVYTEKAQPYNYKQPNSITPEMELKDEVSGTEYKNAEEAAQYVNSNTGAFSYAHEDFSFPVYNINVSFVRSHVSTLENRKSPFGDKWDYSYNKYLSFYKDGTIGYSRGDGSRIYFRKSGSTYVTNAATHDILTAAGEYYVIKTPENILYRFGKTGLLTNINDRNNNTIKVQYDDNDWQTIITDPVNRQVKLEYLDSGSPWCGNISSVTLPDNSKISFVYGAGSNKLEKYIDAEQFGTVYGYDDKMRVRTITPARQYTIITNEYTDDGRVLVQQDGENNSVSFDYDPGMTTFKDAEQNIYTYYYNSRKWLTKKAYPGYKYENYEHTGKGDVNRFTDRMRNNHVYEYNDLGYIKKYTRPDNNAMLLTYKEGYLLETAQDFERNITEYHYDSNNNLEQKIQYYYEGGIRKSAVTDYDFTTKGLLVSQKDADNVTVTIDNSSYPQAQKISYGSNEYEYNYDSMGRIITITDPKLNVTRIAHDRNGRVTAVQHPGSLDVYRAAYYDYDENGNLKCETTSRTLPDGSGSPIKIYDYDGNDRLKTITDVYGYTITYDYDGNGNIKTEEDQENGLTSYDYDEMDRLTDITYPGYDQPTYTYGYDNINNITHVEEADGDSTDYVYDYSINKVKTITRKNITQTLQGMYTFQTEGSTNQHKVSFEYDEMGNLTKEIGNDVNTKDYLYDDLYRVKKITEPGNKITTVDYSDSGRIKKIKDSKDITFIYDYNPIGQLEETEERYIDPVTQQLISTSTGYTYDDNGNIKTIENGEGKTTVYDYNEINKISEVTDPMYKTISYEYDEDGNMRAVTGGEDNTTYMEYDGLNRLYTTSIPEADDTKYTYLYDGRGLIKHYIDPMQNITEYRYDTTGRLDELEKDIYGSDAQLEKYDYYPDGTLQKITYPDNITKEFGYDFMDRPVSIKDRAGMVQSISYTAAGKPEDIIKTKGSTLVDKAHYEYDGFGRVESLTDIMGRTEVYDYDRIGNISAIKGIDGNTTAYNFDPKGRIRQVIDPESKLTEIEYNNVDQIISMKKTGNRTYSYQYDDSGNLKTITDPLNNTTEYLYNDNNMVKQIINARNYTKKYDYNALNKLKTVTDERDNTTVYDYYPGGSLQSVTDPKNNTTAYTYDGQNRIKTIENALNETTGYTYDPMDNIKTMTDERGVRTVYSYTPDGKELTVSDTQGNTTIKAYNIKGELQRVTDQEGRITAYQYDDAHRIRKVTESGGYAKNYIYDSITGDIERIYDNSAKSTTYVYDKMHRLLTETNEQQHITSYTYDDFGNLKTKQIPDGNITTYGYDELDRITSILAPEYKFTEIGYDEVGNIDYMVKPENQRYDYTYDAANNLAKILDPLGQETEYTYDASNNIATMQDPSGNLYTYNYDALNRLQSIADLTNGGTGYQYDESGNLSTFTDGNGNTTFYEYDSSNRLISVKDPEANITKYTYYKDGRLESMTDGRGDSSYYTYDTAGNLSSFENPLGEVKKFEYTLLGQIKKITKPDEKQINYRYDQYNRLNSILYPGGDTVSYQYDEFNRKTGMTDINGVSNYEYDGMDRLTTYIDPADEEVNYEYDEKGRKTKIVYPDGKIVSYDYDEHDRLVTVTDREGRETTYTYDEAGRRKTTTYPNGITTTHEYDQKNRITKISSISSSGGTVEKIEYEYDGAGNKTKEEIWKEDKHYLRAYDYYKNNTIKSMEETGDNNAKYSYSYDGAGNVTEKTIIEDGKTTQYTYTYDESNRMTRQAENGITTRTYKYDLNGNRIQRILSDETDGDTVEGVPEQAAVEQTAENALQAEEEAVVPEEEALESSTGTAKGKGKSSGKKGGAKTEATEETNAESMVLENTGEESEAGAEEEPAAGVEVAEEALQEESTVRKTADYYYYDDADRLVEIVEHSGKVFTYGYDGEGNRLWRTYSQSTAVKPPVQEGERLQVPPGKIKGNDKDKNNGKNEDSDNEKGNGNGENEKSEPGSKGGKLGWKDGTNGLLFAAAGDIRMSISMLIAYDKGGGKGNGKGGDNDKDNGNGGGNNGDKDKDNSNDGDKIKGNDSKGNGKDKINERGKGKNKEHINRGKHLGWYKRLDHPQNPGGIDLNNPEVFEVTNYINDISVENEEVLMTTDIDGNYRGVYTYGIERISAEDLVSIEGRPNNPLYYLYDAIGTTTSITNMNAGIIDSNRFAPYGEPLDPVAKNSRLTNSPFGFTGEMHDLEGGLVYLRARYYEPKTMQFIQQDTMFGDTMEPLTRNLYIYGNANPLTYVDPSGHWAVVDRWTKDINYYRQNWERFLGVYEPESYKALQNTELYKQYEDEMKNSNIYTREGAYSFSGKYRKILEYKPTEEEAVEFLKGRQWFKDKYSVNGKLYRYQLRLKYEAWRDELEGAKTVLSWMPVPTDMIAYIYEQSNGYVEGNSITSEFSATSNFLLWGAGKYIGKLGKPVLKKVVDRLDNANNAISTYGSLFGINIESLDLPIETEKTFGKDGIINKDKIAYDLMKRAYIPLYGNTKNDLVQGVDMTYAYIDVYRFFFLQPFGTRFIGSTSPDGSPRKSLYEYSLEMKNVGNRHETRYETLNRLIVEEETRWDNNNSISTKREAAMDKFKVLVSQCDSMLDELVEQLKGMYLNRTE